MNKPVPTSTPPSTEPRDFIRQIIDDDLRLGRHDGRVHTRFPPEPNGFLHIGHAKSIYLNFGVAEEFGGKCNLRFDDTNPLRENIEYVQAIERDVKWLGFNWANRLYYAADYFDQMYTFAEQLIRQGQAYVDDQSAEEIRQTRGTLTEPGVDSPYRHRTVEENLDLFRRMRAGEFPDGAKVLRAKIDMQSGNINMRDPTLYRIRHAHHHRTGDAWCIYPMYTYAHPIEDAIEGITHSLCTLEFEAQRPFYDWVINSLDFEKKPRQIEFARLNLNYTVMSKRKLLRLVEERHVRGWDDPRLPTIAGFRRRGYTPEAIRDFCERIGLAKKENVIDVALLEHCVREDLNKRAARRMAILRPLRVVILNYPEDTKKKYFEAVNNPEDPDAGTRRVPFSRVLYINHDDFRESPPSKYFRLAPGMEVRLRYAYIVKCVGVVKDESGAIVEVHCEHDAATLSGKGPEAMRRVKGTIHWVSARHAHDAEVRLYDRLFSAEDPEDVPEGGDFIDGLNPRSLEILHGCKIEPALAEVPGGTRVQFERTGYFSVDPDSRPGAMVFNRVVGLRDTWAKLEART